MGVFRAPLGVPGEHLGFPKGAWGVSLGGLGVPGSYFWRLWADLKTLTKRFCCCIFEVWSSSGRPVGSQGGLGEF